LSVSDATLAGDSLAGALAVAGQFPQFIETAQGAFLSGLSVVALIAAVLLTLVAAIAYVMFRKLPVLGGPAPAEEPSAKVEADVIPVPAE
jgi:hypothetical protein